MSLLPEYSSDEDAVPIVSIPVTKRPRVEANEIKVVPAPDVLAEVSSIHRLQSQKISQVD